MIKTKFVYVVVSTNDDFFAEQTWASLWSLKHYNPQSHTVLVMDRDTHNAIMAGKRKKMLELVDEPIVVDVTEVESNMEKSRWLKTSLRELVAGDYLYMDGDTLVTADLSDVDSFECEIGMIPDGHVPFERHYEHENVMKAAKRIFNITPPF